MSRLNLSVDRTPHFLDLLMRKVKQNNKATKFRPRKEKVRESIIKMSMNHARSMKIENKALKPRGCTY